VPEALSPISANSVVFNASEELEHRYNMDPTSLALIALELADIRKDKEEAFEYFL
jgi:thiamine pyrophosphokinase